MNGDILGWSYSIYKNKNLKKRTETSSSSCPTQNPPRGICRVMCVVVLKLAPYTYLLKANHKPMSKPQGLLSPPAPLSDLHSSNE